MAACRQDRVRAVFVFQVRWFKLVFNLVITAYVRDLLLLNEERARLISSELIPTVTAESSESSVFSHRP
jgi:hypothetical protein